MDLLQKNSGVVALIAVVLAIGSYFYSPAPKSGGIGDYTNYSKLKVDDSSTGALIVNSSSFVVDSTNNRIGIGTSTPGAMVSLGGSGTTTIVTGALCLATRTAGSGTGYLYMWPATSSAAQVAGGGYSAGGWATSTTACYSTP